MKILLQFSAGRRDFATDCAICGTPIHQRPSTRWVKRAASDLWTMDEALAEEYRHYDEDDRALLRSELDALPGEGAWYDGHGETTGLRRGDPAAHEHQPAKPDGPTLEFDDYVQITYSSIRYEGDDVAWWDETRGDWIIADGYEGAGEAYSDVSISAKETPNTAERAN
jgi:hypothetical protein